MINGMEQIIKKCNELSQVINDTHATADELTIAADEMHKLADSVKDIAIYRKTFNQ